MAITNISVVGIPPWTGAATPYIHVNDLNDNNKYFYFRNTTTDRGSHSIYTC
jgi:hypothetical protein